MKKDDSSETFYEAVWGRDDAGMPIITGLREAKVNCVRHDKPHCRVCDVLRILHGGLALTESEAVEIITTVCVRVRLVSDETKARGARVGAAVRTRMK